MKIEMHYGPYPMLNPFYKMVPSHIEAFICLIHSTKCPRSLLSVMACLCLIQITKQPLGPSACNSLCLLDSIYKIVPWPKITCACLDFSFLIQFTKWPLDLNSLWHLNSAWKLELELSFQFSSESCFTSFEIK